MWSPTHIQVTVQRARGLLTKGKNDTNNCFVTIALGKEKYQTSIQEKASKDVSWNEECELKIPDQGNRAELTLTCLHRNNLSLDEFLGHVTLPLNEMDAYDRPRSKWFKLESKPGKEKKNKERGELEVRICFIVKSGSLTDLSKKEKHKSSIGQLASSVGGSLLSIGTIEKRKGIKKFAKSLGSKMHLSSKKKNKDGDDISSYSGSQLSIGTPNSFAGADRRNGQRAGEADPGVISEDEDEFVFDNLSHKSSGSSLNLRVPQNNAPRKLSPLLNSNGNGKVTTTNTKIGKQLHRNDADEDLVIDAELEQIENDFSVRARNLLPPPSKPPRTPQNEPRHETLNKKAADEWESKLYGDKGNSNSLNRRSWEQNRVPLIATANEQPKQTANDELQTISLENDKSNSNGNSGKSDSDSSTTDTDEEPAEMSVKKPLELQLSSTPPKLEQSSKLYSPEQEENKFNELNSTFARIEQRKISKIFEDDDKLIFASTFIKHEKDAAALPQPLPRNRERELELKMVAEEDEQEKQLRAEEDARLEEELRLNEQRLREEEAALQEELQQQEEQKRRETKRREEDQRILNFAKRSVSLEEEQTQQPEIQVATESITSPENSPRQKDATVELREKRIGKFKFAVKRDKNDEDRNSSSPKSTERIIIGHEKSMTQAERRAEISAALAKKYEGKSREEIMLIANGMENEALLQRQRVKELEDYLDNLLLRVMETHPKILQNPYHRTTSAKSG